MNELEQAILEAQAMQVTGAPVAPVDPISMQGQDLESALREAKGMQFEHQQKVLNPYNTLPQQALAGLEAVGQGVLGPVATGAEALLSGAGVPGLDPQSQALRKQASPFLTGVTEPLAFVGSMFTGVGEAALLAKLGEGALTAAKLSKVSGLPARIGAGALQGLVEGAAFGTGDEISKLINQDPHQSTATALSDVGLMSVMGGAAGGLFGGLSHMFTKNTAPAIEQGLKDFKSAADPNVPLGATAAPGTELEAIKTLEKAGLKGELGKINKEAAEIAAKRDWPALEGIVSDSKVVQYAEDALLSSGTPTVSGMARRKAYDEAFQKVSGQVGDVITPAVTMSETEAGNAVKKSLLGKLESEYDVSKQIYKELEPYKAAIDISKPRTTAISRTIKNIIKDNALVKGTPEHSFVNTWADGIKEITSLDQLANFRTALGRATGQETKFVSGLIREKLDVLEDKVIRNMADQMKNSDAKNKVMSLIGKMDEAKSGYKAFREKLQELGNSLGKKRIYGPQDFMDFVEGMNPQTLADRIFKQGNTEFAEFFAKSFPEEMQTIAQYQKGLIKEAGVTGLEFSPIKSMKKALSMEPEMQKILFTPEQVSLLQDADKYIRKFPKKFNPSGTAHMAEFLDVIDSPIKFGIANLRDTGLKGFIKAAGHASPLAGKEGARLMSVLGKAALQAEANPIAFKHAVEFSLAAIRGVNNMTTAAASFFNESDAKFKKASKDQLKHLDEKVEESMYSMAPLEKMGGDLGYYMPDHAAAMAQQATQTLSYLASIKPHASKPGPYEEPIPPSQVEMNKYHRALTLAQDPLAIVDLMKTGTMTHKDVEHLQAMHPSMYDAMAQSFTNMLAAQMESGKPVKFKQKQMLSMFMGLPASGPTSAKALQANQAAFNQVAAQKAQRDQATQAQVNPTVGGLSKLNEGARTSLRRTDDADANLA